MIDNIIPYIGGEEEKSENEPLKIWGELKDGAIVPTRLARYYHAMHSCANQRRPYGGRVCEI